MSRLKHLVVVFFALLSMGAYAGNTILEDAWDAFKNNKIEKSRELFEKAKLDPDSKEEALLMLSILAGIDQGQEQANAWFIEFLNSTSDPIPYLYCLFRAEQLTDHKSILPEVVLSYLEATVAKPGLHPTVYGGICHSLATHYHLTNQPDKAEIWYRKIGSVTEWQVAGSFENISESGFNNNYKPRTVAHPDSVFKNKYNAPVSWFDVKGIRPGRWVNIDEVSGYYNSINFAQTFCNSMSNQAVQLRIGCSGSLIVWVNDQMVFSEAEESDNDIDSYVINTWLRKGNNRILLQVGTSEVDNSNFMVRITSPKGEVLPGLTFSRTYSEYSTEALPGPSSLESNPMLDFFRERIKKDPNNIANYLVLNEGLYRFDNIREIRKNVNTALALAPDCSYLRYQLIRVYSDEENETSLSLELERLKKNDPEFPLSLSLLFDEAIDKENYVDAKNYLNSLENIFGLTPGILDKKMRLASEKEEQEQLLELIAIAYKKFPDEYSFVSLASLVEEQVNKNKVKAVKIIRKYLKTHNSSKAKMKLMELYFGLNNVTGAIAILEEMHKSYPYDPYYKSILGEVYYEMRNYPKAIACYEECIRMTPYTGTYHDDLGKTYKEMGNTEQAILYFEKAVAYNPNNYDTRHDLFEIQGRKPVFENFVEPDVYEIFKDAPDASAYPEDNSIILLHESQQVVYQGGGREDKYILVVKVFNTKGIDDWKEYQVYAVNQRIIIEKAEVLKKDGNRIKAEVSGGQVVFTNLEPGDGIAIVYRARTFQSGRLIDQFWDQFTFGSRFPMLKSKYSLMVPDGTTFQHVVSNGDLKPVVKPVRLDEDSENSNLGKFIIYEWERKNVAAIREEPLMTPLSEVAEYLHISSIPDWNFIANWYHDLSRAKTKNSFEVEELVNELLKGKEKLSQLEQAKVFYEYIVKNIRYSSVSFRQSGLVPQKASHVLSSRVGDCKDVSTLFIAMCAEVGIDAHIVLVNTRDNGRKDMVLPSIDFNHAIAKARLDGKDYFIELTSDYNPFAVCGEYLQHAFVLEVYPDSVKKAQPYYLNPPTRLKNGFIRTSTVSFDGDVMKVNRQTQRLGDFGASFRNNFRDKGDQERRKTLTESLSSDYNNLKLIDLVCDSSLTTTAPVVKDSYTFTVGRSITEVAGLNLFTIPFADQVKDASFVSAETRNYGLELWRFWEADTTTEQLTITPPAGKQFVEIPKNVILQCPSASYELTFSRSGQNLIVRRNLIIKKSYVDAAEYTELKDFMNKVIKADATQVAFK
jgi:tetratricopeptide (TPR) repeat protein/transglutaminase-like putative cysteine protease